MYLISNCGYCSLQSLLELKSKIKQKTRTETPTLRDAEMNLRDIEMNFTNG